MRLVLHSLLVVTLAACTRIDFDYPKTESSYIADTADTYLAGEIAAEVANQAPGESGFYPLEDGIDALIARLRLIDVAERSLDIQYYLIKRDLVGQQFMYELLKAADRGVRVRLQLDDMFTKGADTDLMALHSHENIEIRIFNPFHRGAMGKLISGFIGFGRVNRRMHNKSFTVDNQVTIIGGRNIADEYFGARKDSAFGDLDVIGIGPIVQDVTNMFELYWDHEASLPLDAFIKPLKDPEAELQALRGRYLLHEKEVEKSRYAEVVIDRLYAQIESDTGSFQWAPYQLVFDTPDKGVKGKADDEDLIIAALAESLGKTETEAFIVSPYFVPKKEWREGLIESAQEGQRVIIVTNSLAANNQKTVHGGYAPARKPLLKGGVELYEVRSDVRVAGTEYVPGSAPRATLHTKAYIVDRNEIFIGSFNFDPRSAFINTEMGVLIVDPDLAELFLEDVEEALRDGTWKVVLNEKGKLEWQGFEDIKPVTYTKEPQTNWWQRFMAGVYRMLPIRSQL